MSRRHFFMFLFGVLLAIHLIPLQSAVAQTVTVDASLLQQLQQLIQQQQQQIETQSGQIKSQSEQIKTQAEVLKSVQQEMKELKQAATEAQSEASEAKSTALQAVDTARQAETVAQTSGDKLVTSGEERIKLAISGQVNRAVNFADDGDKTKVYFVDNDSSNTRFRFVGTGKVTDDLTIGSKLEIAMTSNESSEVSQDNEDAGDFSDVRWAEVSFDSKRFGKLSVGKGDTASNNSAEVDLSKTDVVQYASIADIAGGLQFSDDGTLTGVTISDAFSDFDGLSRKDRVRYDSPAFYGFRVAGSAVSDQRWDSSIWWGGQGYGFKAGAAAAVADRNEDGEDLQYDGSFSLLHEDTGLNLTVSAGTRDKDGDDPTNVYTKAGWIADFFSVGSTAFGVDYTRSFNLPTASDDGYSVGVAAVQSLDDYGTEIYAQFRLYSLDRDDEPSVDDISVGTLGTRVKF